MTRLYAARALLAHGPLQFREFVEIAGWPTEECKKVLQALKRQRAICCDGQHREYTTWRLAR